MATSLSVLLVIGVMLLRRRLLPDPVANVPLSGLPHWNRWRLESLQGNTTIGGAPLANNDPFPPMNLWSAPTNQVPLYDPFPPTNTGNVPQLPFPPADDWFVPPDEP